MTLATPFKKTKLSALLLVSLFAASSCTTLNSENQSQTQSLNGQQSTVANSETTDVKASKTAALDTTQWAQKLSSCSADYKKLIEPEIKKFANQTLTYDKLFDQKNSNIDLANQLSETESLLCKNESLTIVEQMNLAKIEAAQQQLQKANLSEAEKRDALSNLLYAQQALFFSYVRHGVLSDEQQDVQLWLNANDIWKQWLNEPVAFTDADAMVTTLMTNKALISTVKQLTDYLQKSSVELKQHPKKKELLLNQTLIFLAQSETNNREVRQSLSKSTESLPWLKQMTEQLSDHQQTDKKAKNASQELTVNQTEKALSEVLQRDESLYFTQLLKLTAIRYQDFNEDKSLESAKTFLTEEVEDLAISELLGAMDYAKIGDQESSKRWLDKAFAHNDIATEICQLPKLNPASLNPFFNEKNGKWFLSEVNKQCS